MGFPRSFVPELRSEIISYLEFDQLRSYALACRAYCTEANRILWRAVHIRANMSSRLDALYDAISRDLERSRHIRELVVMADGDCFDLFPPVVDEVFWERMVRVLGAMPGLVTLDLIVDRDFAQRVEDFVWYKPLLGAITQGVALARLVTFKTNIPGNDALRICNAWSSLRKLTLDRTSPFTLSTEVTPQFDLSFLSGSGAVVRVLALTQRHLQTVHAWNVSHDEARDILASLRRNDATVESLSLEFRGTLPAQLSGDGSPTARPFQPLSADKCQFVNTLALVYNQITASCPSLKWLSIAAHAYSEMREASMARLYNIVCTHPLLRPTKALGHFKLGVTTFNRSHTCTYASRHKGDVIQWERGTYHREVITVCCFGTDA